MMKKTLLLILGLGLFFASTAQNNKNLPPYILIVQPIVLQSDDGLISASMALPEDLVDRAYEKAGIDFLFLEPIYYKNSQALYGEINLDSIVRMADRAGLIKGQNDIVNMFFVDKVDGLEGPLGRGMMGGNLTFIALGENKDKNDQELKYMQAFVIAHEVGHNLSLKHAVDDENVNDTLPNIQGDGEFKDRIDPEYSLNDYQIELIKKSPLVHPRVEFLSKEKAKLGILDESFEPYFSQLQKREISAFVQKESPLELIKTREFAKEQFSSAVIEFSSKEKKCISFTVGRINDILLKNGIALMPNHPWRFIKIENWLCGGFAHTRGTYIILSQKHLDHLSKSWSENMTLEEEQVLMEKLGSLLVHEQMHSLQRTFKSKFIKLYTEYWNFIQADIKSHEIIEIDRVSNPDAPIAEWLIPNPQTSNSYFWVRTLLKDSEGIPVMGKDFKNEVFNLSKAENAYQLLKDEQGNIIRNDMSIIAFYEKSIPPNRGIDHPNEISAYLFADYFKALVNNTKAFENIEDEAKKNTQAFLNWIENEMK